MAIFNSYVKLPEGTPFGNLDFQRGVHPGTGRVCTGSGSAVDRRTVRSAPQESDTKAAKSTAPTTGLETSTAFSKTT